MYKTAFFLVPMLASGICAAAPTYEVVTLAAPPKFAAIDPMAVNDLGDFVGRAYTFGSVGVPPVSEWYAWTQTKGYMVVLGPGGAAVTSLSGINRFDQAIGTTADGAFVWDPVGGATGLTRPTDYKEMVPYAINDLGQVVGGLAKLKLQSRTLKHRAAFSWTLETGVIVLPHSEHSAANAINNAGRIGATRYELYGNPYAYRVKNDDHATPVVSPNGPETTSWAVGINESDEMAVNLSDIGTPYPRFGGVWSEKGGLKQLAYGHAIGIDDLGEVLGFNGLNWDPLYTGYIWTRADNIESYIIDRLAPGSPAFDLLYTNAISPSGIIAARASADGVGLAALLIPRR